MGLFKDKPSWQNPFYTFGEELANSVTHGIGAVLAVAGMVALVALGFIYGDRWRVIGFTVYGLSLIILYSASTLYHGVQQPQAKKIFRRLDHTAIYVLIAGTYTPFLLITMRGTMGWTLLAVVWTMAAAGILWKIFFLGRLEVLATLMYLFMGWMGVLAFRQLLENIPPTGLTMLLAGGVIYTVGVIFYAWEKLPYNHAIWHLFVLGGSACHFFAITTLV
ncbi:MAG: hemolysin III family protein [Candidatus Promineifilaceae bacterium]|nr:hemolysin III family protein [Candidatus Promineifilaceae bacterium]